MAAMRMSRFAARHNIDLLFLHVPGDSLVAEGVDAASSSLAESERGPACTLELRRLIQAAAGRQGWTVYIDLFACSENAICLRFYSRFPDAAASATDALCALNRNVSGCPACGLSHREVSFASPRPP